MELQILTVSEISGTLRKSERWVYKNAVSLGGFKIGGSWIFTQKGVEDAIQRKQEMESKNNGKRAKIYKSPEYKKRGNKLGNPNPKELEKDAKRHGLDKFLH